MATRKEITKFQSEVWNYFDMHRRELPWRVVGKNGQIEPYGVLVSELMLQQTQVNRVAPKYANFLLEFPTVQLLADAPLSAVVKAWSGLGYNRRARYLHHAAQQLTLLTGPWTAETLVALKGIGKNTASAIETYAYNTPTVFIETNIRTVFLHHFFAGLTDVHDNEILPLVEQTLDNQNSREWYWALMDYGTYLKSEFGNASRRSLHYTKQSSFAGSNRQARGLILKQLATRSCTKRELLQLTDNPHLKNALDQLIHEGLVVTDSQQFRLADN